MKRKLTLTLTLLIALLALVLTACGGDTAPDTTEADPTPEAVAPESTPETQDDDNTDDGEAVSVKLGVVGAIYEDLWTPAQQALAQQGINLEFVQFSDYVTPNNALDNGEIDLNAFQHHIYLDSELEAYGYDLSVIGYTFIIPLNLYSAQVDSLDQLKDGDTVAIPNDLTNGGRALKVLEAAGLIVIDDEAQFSPTVDDIAEYVVDIDIVELAANTIASSLEDVTAGIVNGNYALDFGLDTSEALFNDAVLDQEEYWNLVAARTADLDDPALVEIYRAVLEAFHTDDTERVFNDTYGGYFVKVGWDVDLLG